MKLDVKFKKALFGFVVVIMASIGLAECPSSFDELKEGVDLQFSVERQKDAGQ